jgi:hypothetical protein
MFEQARYARIAWIPILSGLGWLWCASHEGLVVGFLFSSIPGCLLLASGVSTLLWPGDLRIAQFTALGGLIGVPLALPAFLTVGAGTGTLLVLLSAASYIAAGAISVRQEPHTAEVPAPQPSLRLDVEVALDDALLATMGVSTPMLAGEDRRRLAEEVQAARDLFEARGWLEKPISYHATPPLLESPKIRRAHTFRVDFEHLSFESEYEPHDGEPGRERWLGYRSNRTAHAWVARHADAARPWLVCIHGYQMGIPLIDFGAFPPAWLRDRLELNLVLPVLPLHGPRKIGRRSGDGFLSGDVLDSVHAEAQAMWDLRRILSWVRAQGGTKIGVFGLSLGGYNTALLSCLDEGLACSIPGIPATDFTHLFWRHGPPLEIRYIEHLGMSRDASSEVMQVVSPLALRPQVPHAHRAIFGAVADRLVPAEQVRDLWRHWDRPRIVWYQGGHVTFRWHRAVRELIESTLAGAGLTR